LQGVFGVFHAIHHTTLKWCMSNFVSQSLKKNVGYVFRSTAFQPDCFARARARCHPAHAYACVQAHTCVRVQARACAQVTRTGVRLALARWATCVRARWAPCAACLRGREQRARIVRERARGPFHVKQSLGRPRCSVADVARLAQKSVARTPACVRKSA
jgi:hypothetical protein